jgi:hypothetical protein
MSPEAISAASSATTVAAVVAELLAAVPAGAVPRFCLSAATVELAEVFAALAQRLPDTVVVGLTSCAQVASDKGASSTAAALFVFGEGFAVGAASGTGRDHEALGRSLTTTALARAGIDAANTRLVVVHATSGHEEALLAGLGATVPVSAVVIGGTSADNDNTGRWSVFGPDGAFSDGASVLVCDWPWQMAMSYQGGYLATEHQGRITAAVGRCVVSIDHKPAAEVYERWLGTPLPREASISAQTALRPFGLAYGVGGGLDVHVLVHPDRVHDDGSIDCFAEVQEGERILMMEASTTSLTRRAGLATRFSMQQAGVTVDDVVAGLLVFCAGGMRALDDDVGPLTDGVKKVLGSVPFLMPFTYGEQGRLRRQRIDHGNLMLAALLLTRKS